MYLRRDRYAFPTHKPPSHVPVPTGTLPPVVPRQSVNNSRSKLGLTCVFSRKRQPFHALISWFRPRIPKFNEVDILRYVLPVAHVQKRNNQTPSRRMPNVAKLVYVHLRTAERARQRFLLWKLGIV